MQRAMAVAELAIQDVPNIRPQIPVGETGLDLIQRVVKGALAGLPQDGEHGVGDPEANLAVGAMAAVRLAQEGDVLLLADHDHTGNSIGD